MIFIKKFIYKEFVQRENSTARAGFIPEMNFYDNIKKGNLDILKDIKDRPIHTREDLGILSSNPITCLKYHVVITAAMISRSCIEGGMEIGLAYTLSDYYIAELDSLNSAEKISKLHYNMCLDYATRMKNLRTRKVFSKHISKCIDYIYDNLHTRITIARLAEEIGISEEYLSRLFKQEIGISVSDYIMRKKIETAENMLKFSDYSIAWIANTLAFTNQSYFTASFKKITGYTPMQYKKINVNSFEIVNVKENK